MQSTQTADDLKKISGVGPKMEEVLKQYWYLLLSFKLVK